jgi:uncharacterized protein (DUF2062 family)
MKKRYLRLVRRAYRHLRHPRWRDHRWWGPLSRRLFERRLWKPCSHTVGGGIGIGLFFAMMPMPMQMVAAALVAMRMRVNIPFAMLACWVSNPFSEPFLRLTQEQFGGWMRDTLGVPMPPVLRDVAWRVGEMEFNLGNFVLGFMTSGLILGLLAYPVVQLVATVIPQHLPRPIRTIKNRRQAHETPSN